MKTFSKYVNLREAIATLSPTDIYDFYWICSALSYNQIDDSNTRTAHFYLRELQELYVRVFTDLLTKQIEKYAQRGRVDPNFKISLSRHPESIRRMMAQTFRSDMTRRNDVWNMIADYLVGLSSTNNVDRICYYIDRINNSVHNTKTLVLDKLPQGHQLLQALDTTHNSKNPKDYAQFVGPEVRRLVRQWFGPGMAS